MARNAKRPRRKPNTGTIRYKRGRARPWEATFPLGRRAKPRTDSFATYEEAAAHLDQLTAERDDRVAPRNIAGGSMGFHQFVTLWLTIKKPHVKRNTYESYVHACGVATISIGLARRIDTIARRDADLLYVTLHEQGYKNVAQLRSVLSQAFDYAEQEDYVKSNPFRRAKAPAIERPRRITLTRAQRAHMLDCAAGDPLEILWHLYSRLGLRRGEGLGLLWANIDWDSKTLTITQQHTLVRGQTVTETPKTKRSRRTIPLPDDILALLRALHKAQIAEAAGDPRWEVTGLVFVGKHGRPYSAQFIYWSWGQLRKKAGITARVTIHDLRHTALTLIEQSGAPLSVVQAFAGHSSAAMTMHYADHADVAEMRAALVGA